MKKRLFGIKLSTIFTAMVCLIVAFAIWMIVKYCADMESTALCCIPYAF